jgi:hypothetical protein
MKPYFNRSTFWLSFALLLYLLSALYYNQLEEIIVSGFWTMDLMPSLWWFSKCVLCELVAAVLIQFILFMRDNNKGSLFTNSSSKSFVHMSTLLFICGGLHLGYIRFDPGGSSLIFSVCIFFGSLSSSFSNIFKEATFTQEEHRLTL